MRSRKILFLLCFSLFAIYLIRPSLADHVTHENDPVDYQQSASTTYPYNAPDPHITPIELRMQEMEAKQARLEQQLEETRKKLAQAITILNRITHTLKS